MRYFLFPALFLALISSAFAYKRSSRTEYAPPASHADAGAFRVDCNMSGVFIDNVHPTLKAKWTEGDTIKESTITLPSNAIVRSGATLEATCKDYYYIYEKEGEKTLSLECASGVVRRQKSSDVCASMCIVQNIVYGGLTYNVWSLTTSTSPEVVYPGTEVRVICPYVGLDQYITQNGTREQRMKCGNDGRFEGGVTACFNPKRTCKLGANTFPEGTPITCPTGGTLTCWNSKWMRSTGESFTQAQAEEQKCGSSPIDPSVTAIPIVPQVTQSIETLEELGGSITLTEELEFCLQNPKHERCKPVVVGCTHTNDKFNHGDQIIVNCSKQPLGIPPIFQCINGNWYYSGPQTMTWLPYSDCDRAEILELIPSIPDVTGARIQSTINTSIIENSSSARSRIRKK